jgi:hypothetical protein
MAIRKRLLVIVLLFAVALVFYGVAKYYSPSLIIYVVEQSLIQKAPPGMDPAVLHKRFHAHISAAPDKNSRLEELFRISAYLEKVQQLTSEQLDELLAVEGIAYSPRRPFRYGPKEPLGAFGFKSLKKTGTFWS